MLSFTRPVNATMNDVKFFLDGVEVVSSFGDNLSQTFNTLGTTIAQINQTAVGNDGTITFATFDIYTTQLNAGDLTTIYNNESGRFDNPLPAVSGFSNGRRFGQGFPQ
jgi:hypothetical protein